MRPRAAIVGAGLSGLSCAQSLTAQGWEVRLFDKARGPGGRSSTRREGDYRFDHGAQYFTARDPRFLQQLATWQDREQAAEWDGRIKVLRGGVVEPVSAGTRRFVGLPGMNAMVRALAEEQDVLWNTRIATCTRSENRWCLEDIHGASLGDFDAVICALPAPQAAELLPAGRLRDEAAALRMQPCWSVMAVFPDPLDLPFDAAFVHDSPLRWIARNASKPGRPEHEAWVLQAGPDWSARYLELNPDEAALLLLDALFTATGQPAVLPVFHRAHRWRYAISDPALDCGFLWDAAQRIGACGDWCHGARIEGAWLSGLELSLEVGKMVAREGFEPSKA